MAGVGDEQPDSAGTERDRPVRMGDGGRSTDGPSAAYVFRVTVRLEPDVTGVWAEPETFETTVFRRADPPGEPGWLYFRDNLWHGECGDPEYMREVTEDALGVPVERVSFSELRTTEGYLDDLREQIAEDRDLFNAATVDEALSKYLGSSIRVTDELWGRNPSTGRNRHRLDRPRTASNGLERPSHPDPHTLRMGCFRGMAPSLGNFPS